MRKCKYIYIIIYIIAPPPIAFMYLCKPIASAQNPLRSISLSSPESGSKDHEKIIGFSSSTPYIIISGSGY